MCTIPYLSDVFTWFWTNIHFKEVVCLKILNTPYQEESTLASCPQQDWNGEQIYSQEECWDFCSVQREAEQQMDSWLLDYSVLSFWLRRSEIQKKKKVKSIIGYILRTLTILYMAKGMCTPDHHAHLCFLPQTQWYRTSLHAVTFLFTGTTSIDLLFTVVLTQIYIDTTFPCSLSYWLIYPNIELKIKKKYKPLDWGLILAGFAGFFSFLTALGDVFFSFLDVFLLSCFLFTVYSSSSLSSKSLNSDSLSG